MTYTAQYIVLNLFKISERDKIKVLLFGNIINR